MLKAHLPQGWTIGYLMQSGPNNFLEQIKVGNSINWYFVSIKIKKGANNWSHSVNNCDKNDYLLIASVIGFTKMMRAFVSPNSIVLPVWLLVEAEDVFVSLHDFLNDVRRLVNIPLCFESICQWLNRSVSIEFLLKIFSQDSQQCGFSARNLLWIFPEG